MLFYDITMTYKATNDKVVVDLDDSRYDIERLNRELANHFDSNKCMIFAYEFNEKIRLALATNLYELSAHNKMCKDLCEISSEILDFDEAEICGIKEITSETYGELYEIADDKFAMDRAYRSFQRTNSGIFRTRIFKASERLITGEYKSKDQAIEEANTVMADQSLMDELNRIYDDKNQEAFYGVPVQYCITADGMEAAESIISIIVKSLYHKKRLPGGRICTFTKITEKCYDDEDFEKICKQSQGTSVVIELEGDEYDHGIYASSYSRVIDFLLEMVTKYKKHTQFFFVRNVSFDGFSRSLISRIKEEMDIVDIREGLGCRSEAERYLTRLINESPMKAMSSSKDMKYLPKKKKYYPHDVQEAFEKWNDECLREKAYPAYKGYKSAAIRKVGRNKTNSYKELQEMIGLDNVKILFDEIISLYKMQKVRGRFGLDEQNICRHMVFTGNPGSAKTTIARLLSDVLADEGILETGKLVECGRADLVGPYVGWTAKIVKGKFVQAKGGILFIDEAYTLIEHLDGSYGDEAINTIVQEMENNRDDVIVIFAGYPDRMKDFLMRNEGLRSRIAFHIEFPDYDKDELMGILENMVHKRGLEIDREAFPICKDIISRACTVKNFGNGRFVRNYLEQAIMRQSLRLAGNKGFREMKLITKEQACRLTADDFMVDPKKLFDEESTVKMNFGFAAS